VFILSFEGLLTPLKSSSICYKYFVTFKYDKSETFRAQIFLLLGTALATPFGIFLMELVLLKAKFKILVFLSSFSLIILGYLSINHAYNIMLQKDELNV
jgi:hypothetical protein